MTSLWKTRGRYTHVGGPPKEISSDQLWSWLRGSDSNRRPPGYEPDELPLLHPARHCSEPAGAGRADVWAAGGHAMVSNQESASGGRIRTGAVGFRRASDRSISRILSRATIYLGPALPPASCSLPGTGRAASWRPDLALLPVEVSRFTPAPPAGGVGIVTVPLFRPLPARTDLGDGCYPLPRSVKCGLSSPG